jgi:hypothetical protein
LRDLALGSNDELANFRSSRLGGVQPKPIGRLVGPAGRSLLVDETTAPDADIAGDTPA